MWRVKRAIWKSGAVARLRVKRSTELPPVPGLGKIACQGFVIGELVVATKSGKPAARRRLAPTRPASAARQVTAGSPARSAVAHRRVPRIGQGVEHEIGLAVTRRCSAKGRGGAKTRRPRNAARRRLVPQIGYHEKVALSSHNSLPGFASRERLHSAKMVGTILLGLFGAAIDEAVFGQTARRADGAASAMARRG